MKWLTAKHFKKNQPLILLGYN